MTTITREELEASDGSSIIGFIGGGTTTQERTVQEKLRDTLSLKDTGTTSDALAALQVAFADLSTGGLCTVPRGAWTLSGTATFTGHRLFLEGEAPYASELRFDPAAPDVAIEIAKPLVATLAVSAITNADPAIVTTSSAHGWNSGDKVVFDGIGGMAQVNGVTYTIANPTSATFELRNAANTDNLDSSAYGAFTSGGNVSKIDAGGSVQGSIRNLGFSSQNDEDKTAIRLVNVANWNIENIGIATGQWEGDSIGIKTEGRQLIRIRDCTIKCARPVVIGNNPPFPTIAADHFQISGGELAGTVGTSGFFPVIEFENGTSFGNVTICETAIVGGAQGIYWNDTSSLGAGFHLHIHDVRFEQGESASSFAIHLASTAQRLQALQITNVRLDLHRNGIYLRNAVNVTLDNVTFPQTSGTALDIEFVDGTVLAMRNCTFQNGAAITLANAKCISRSRYGASQTRRGAFEVWVYDDGGANLDRGSILTDGATTSSDIPVADAGTHAICTNGFSGYVEIVNSQRLGATFYLRGTSNSVSERDDPDSHYSATKDTANSTNVYWDANGGGAGIGRYMLQNLRGTSLTYNILKRGRMV